MFNDNDKKHMREITDSRARNRDPACCHDNKRARDELHKESTTMQMQMYREELGKSVLTQRKRSFDIGLAVENDCTSSESKRTRINEHEEFHFSSSYARMTATCGPHECTSTEGATVPPVEAGAKQTCVTTSRDSHHTRQQKRPNSTHEKPGKAATENCKIIRHNTPRVELPRFSLGGSFFHAMICYHAKTEGESGNNLSFELYKTIRELSLADVNLKIPRYAWGSWPFFAEKPATFIPKQAKVYLNRECLQDGQDWEVGIINGLSTSMVTVCLLSFNEDGSGSLGDLTTLKPGKDRVDHFLLELIIGHELQALGEYTARCAILPILIGPQRQDSSFQQFPFGKLGLLSQEPSVMTNNRAAYFLASLGVRDEQIKAMQARSVRQHVDLILKNQGVQASTYANQDELVLEGARRCLMVIRKAIFDVRMDPKRFANNRPHGQEVVDWLGEKRLSPYIPVFLHHGLDTLLAVSKLSRAQVSQLVDEYRDLNPLNHTQQSLDAGGHTAERDESIDSELDLWLTISSLENDPRARTMAERLEWFEDSAAAWHIRGETTTPNMVSCPIPWAHLQQKVALHAYTHTDFHFPLSIHAVGSSLWTRNCVERYIEIQIIFIILCVALLYNLIQMQKKYVTWYDYCQESFVHNMETFLIALWSANLRLLGYNGRTLHRDFALAILACIIRQGFSLRLMYGQSGKNEEAIETALHMFNSCMSWVLCKYRPEYYNAYQLCQVLFEHLVVTGGFFASKQTGLLIIVTLIISIFYSWALCHSAVFGRKATKEANRFRGAWLECSQRNPEIVTELAKLCKRITVHLDKQRTEALQRSWWSYRFRMYWWSPWGRAQAFLEQRVGRWSFLGKVKLRQESTDLDLLIAKAGAINEKFQDLVSEIAFNGCSANHSCGLEFVAGPVKQPMRILQKLVRRYRRDVGRLTDLVRCTVIADSLENVKDFLELIYSISLVGLNSAYEEENGKASRRRFGEQLDTRDQIFRITALENRFDPSYNDVGSMGYRDLALNIEVGWLVSKGLVAFQKVCDWQRLNCLTHICEIQIRTRAIHVCAVDGHEEYLVLRNGLSQ